MAIVLMESWISTAVSRVAVGPYYIGGGVMSLRVPTSLRLWTICVSRDMTSGTRRDAQGRSSKKGAKMISTTH